jgi:hypothetical protein
MFERIFNNKNRVHIKNPLTFTRLKSFLLFSMYGPNSETSSSYGDSGIQSSSSRPSTKQQQQQQQQQPVEPQQQAAAARRGLSEFFSKGITANWKLLSKSSQQVAD